MYKKIFLTAITLLLLQCKGNNKLVIIEVPRSLASLPVLALDHQQFGDKKIVVRFFSDHLAALSGMAAGQTDFVLTGPQLGISFAGRNPDVVHLATPVWGDTSVITRLDIDNITGLEGKKITLPFENSPVDMQMRRIFKHYKMNGVKIDYMPFNKAIELMEEEKTDAVCLPEPVATKLVREGKFKRLALLADEWEKATGQKAAPELSLFSRRSFLEKNPDAVIDIIKALKRNTGNSAKLAEKHHKDFGIESDILREAAGNIIFLLPGRNETIRLHNRHLDLTAGKQAPDSFYYKYE